MTGADPRASGLWFAREGYFVVVTASRARVEPVARAIVGKL